jgi:hypothetical protein
MPDPFEAYEPTGTPGVLRFRKRGGGDVTLSGVAAEEAQRRHDGLKRFDQLSQLGPKPSPAGTDDMAAALADLRREYEAKEEAKRKPQAHVPAQKAPLIEQGDAMAADAKERAEYDRKHGLVQGRQGTAGQAFKRAAIETGAETAMFPVTFPARILRAAGVDNAAADLSGARLLEDLEHLERRLTPAQVRRDREAEKAHHPTATVAGEFVGEAVASAIPGGLIAAGGRMAARRALAASNPAAYAAMRAREQRGAVDISVPRNVVKSYPEAAEFAEKARSARELARTTASKAYRKKLEDGVKINTNLAVGHLLHKHPFANRLRSYMTSGSDSLNTALRTGKVTPDIEKEAEELSTVLEDASAIGLTYDGDTVRGLVLPTDVVDEWTNKGAIRNESFWSTTTHPETRDNFARVPAPMKEGTPMSPQDRVAKESVLLTLKQKSGVPVGGFEEEVLIPSGRNWIVESVERGAGKAHLVLREVDRLPPGVVPAVSGTGLAVTAGALSTSKNREESR